MKNLILNFEEFLKENEEMPEMPTIDKKKSDLDIEEEDSAYQEFFAAKLKQYGVKSPQELDDTKKKTFFDEVSADWKKHKD